MLIHRAVASALIVAALIGLAAPGAASRIVETEITCPLNGKKFQTLIQSSAYVRGQRLDTRPYGAVTSPSPMPVCDGVDRFPVFKPTFTPEEMNKIRAVLNTPEYKAARSEPTYARVAILEDALGESAYEVGLDWLRAAWQAEDSRNTEREKRYLGRALDKFEEASRGMSTADEKWKVANLLLVELSRRLGRFDEASNRLEQFEKAATKASLKIPADVVQQQRELIKLKDAAAHRVGVVKSCSVCATEAQACSERLPSTEPAGLGVAEALCAANRRSCELDCTGKVD